MVSLSSPYSGTIKSPIIIFFSLPNHQNNTTPPSIPPPRSNRKPPVRRINISTPPPPIQQQEEEKKKKKKKKKQPSVTEIERAIGAGAFRDRDTTDSDSEENKTLFDRVFLRTIGKTEGSAEKKLREAGEWVLDRTEGASRSSGDKILKVMFIWILPLWILSFFVASGFIKLPFSTPLLDDLIM